MKKVILAAAAGGFVAWLLVRGKSGRLFDKRPLFAKSFPGLEQAKTKAKQIAVTPIREKLSIAAEARAKGIRALSGLG